MSSSPVTLVELAGRLGHGADWLYRRGRLERLYAEGMPRPQSLTGRATWERASIEAWLTRHHPLARTPANDWQSPPAPANDAAWSDTLNQAYRQPVPAPGAQK